MSLFHTREICSFQSSAAFDPRAVQSVDKLGVVVVGSLDGQVSVYVPKLDKNVTQKGLVYSVNLKSPVLQIQLLNYMSDAHCICVLTSQRVVAMSVSLNQTDKHLKMLFEHKLGSSDFYSMYCGGGAQTNQQNDFIFALSVKGVIKLYQCDRAVYSITLPDMLYPSPIAYSSSNDSVIFQRRSMVLSCYLQNNMAMMSDETSTKKSLVHQWELYLPELILDLQILDEKDVIFILGTTSVFMASPSQGQIIRQINVEGVRIRAMHVFVNSSSIMQLYATAENQIIIYSGARRVWSSSANCDIIGLTQTTCEELTGCLCLLARNWTVNIKYLGTRPLKRVFQSTETRLSLTQIETEIEKYSAILCQTTETNCQMRNEQPILIKTDFSKTHIAEQIELKIDVTVGVADVSQVTVTAILADGNMGEVKLFDNEPISSHCQVFGLITLSKRCFLKSSIEITVTAIGSDGSPTVSHFAESLPLECYSETISTDSSNLLPDVSIEIVSDSSMLKSLFNYDDKSCAMLRFVSDEKISINLKNSSLLIAGESTGVMVMLRYLESKLQQLTIGKLSHKENLLEKLGHTLEELSKLCKLKFDLCEKLATQVKFMTATEKNILIKSRDKNEESKFVLRMNLVNEASESVTALRKAIVETKSKLSICAVRAYSQVELLLLSHLTQSDLAAKSAFAVIELVAITADEDVMAALDDTLNTLAALLGLSLGSSTQTDATRIKKRLGQLLSKINPHAIQGLKQTL